MAYLVTAVLVDLDGTLLDSLPALRVAYRRFLEAHGRVPSDDEFDRWNGPSLPEIVAGLTATHRLQGEAPALLSEYYGLLQEAYLEAPLMAGAAELLAWLSSEPLAVALVTSASTGLATKVLERHGLRRHVQVVVGGDLVLAGKPAPDLYLMGLEQLGARPEAALAIEDSPAGVRAARAAAMRCVGVAAEADRRDTLLRAGAAVAASNLWEARAVCAALASGAGREVRARAVGGKVPSRGYFFSADCEAAVARIWDVEVDRRNGLVDGETVALRGWRLEAGTLELTCERVHYRHLLAQSRDLPLGLMFLGVSAITLIRDVGGHQRVLLGRRAADVTHYPLHWELVPSGGVSVAHVASDGTVNFRGQIAEELAEEAGINGDAILDVRCLGLLEDVGAQVVDVALEVELSAAATAYARGVKSEYTEIVMVPLEQVTEYITERGLAVPSVAALMRLRDPDRRPDACETRNPLPYGGTNR